MAASLNKVMLIGNLTRNPELNQLPNGTSVCEFGLAINRRFSVNGADREETTFVDIVAWRGTAESCARFLQKGSQVFVEGRLKLDQWEDPSGGGRRSKLRVEAENVQFLSSRRDGQGGQDGGSGGYQNGGAGGYQNGGSGGYQNGGGSGGPGGYQRGGNYAPQGGPGAAQSRYGNNPTPPPVPEEAFNVNDDVEDDIPF